MKKITQEMIDATIHEIEEPLITAVELAEILKITKQRVNEIALRLKIKAYRITINMGQAQNAYNEEMVKKIIAYKQANKKFIRKNILKIV